MENNPMTWTRDRPTQPGWYWWRGITMPMCVVRIVDWRGDGELYVRDGENLTALNECYGNWSGPIPQPEEGT